MKRTLTLGAVALSFALIDAAPARAQFGFGPYYRPGYTAGFAYGGGFGFAYRNGGFRVAGFAGGFSYRSVYVPPAVWGGPCVPWSPVFPAISPLTPWGFGPGFLQPGWGVGPGWGWNPVWGGIPWGPNWGPWAGPGVFGPPVVVFPQPVVVAGGIGRGDADALAVAAAAGLIPKQQPENDLPRGANANDYFVIRPKAAAPPPGQIVPQVQQVAAIVPPRKPAFVFDPFALKTDVPDPDPIKEAARLVKLGRAAFAAGDFGKAGEQFDRAIASNPKAAEPHFLKAQAAIATANYLDAMAAVRTGLDLNPAWAGGAFDPKEPYGPNALAFATHLAELRKVVAANPGQPVPEFLLGYQLWFIGEKAEAKKWFALAEKNLPAPDLIALFK